MIKDFVNYDKQTQKEGRVSYICGIDEAGRGSLIDTIFVAGFVTISNSIYADPIMYLLNDSKKMKEKDRNKVYKYLQSDRIMVKAVVEVLQADIESKNPTIATIDAITNLVDSLYNQVSPKKYGIKFLVDGDYCVSVLQNNYNISSIIKGDGKSAAIACASVIAKVERDKKIIELDKEFPEYNWKKNKGYPTFDHIEAIKKYGKCKYHRKNYLLKSLGEK